MTTLFLQKMKTELLAEQVHYYLGSIHLNDILQKRIRLQFTGVIKCRGCGIELQKSYQQGYCFNCMRKLPECDICMVRPEKCHFAQGTCRDEQWAQNFCFRPHIIYLANTTDLKVGITRKENIPFRWMDQGATEALPILEVPNRYASGLVEEFLATHFRDKTSWQKMLKSSGESIDLVAVREEIFAEFAVELESLEGEIGEDFKYLEEQLPTYFNYPVEKYPAKVKAHNFDKHSCVEGILQGIKGQYLILDSGVLNIRKFSGYQVEVQYE